MLRYLSDFPELAPVIQDTRDFMDTLPKGFVGLLADLNMPPWPRAAVGEDVRNYGALFTL